MLNPTPVKAEQAWNLAESRDGPVWVRATVAIRGTKMERVSTARKEIIEIMRHLIPVAVASTPPSEALRARAGHEPVRPD